MVILIGVNSDRTIETVCFVFDIQSPNIPLNWGSYGSKSNDPYGLYSSGSANTSGSSSGSNGTHSPVFPEQSGIQIGFTSPNGL